MREPRRSIPVRITGEDPTPLVLERAAGLLRQGQLVAFPTETVYGLGANALDPDAVERIFAAKGRPPANPLIVHIPDVDAAPRMVTAWPETAARLAARWWPGPLTLVLPKSYVVPANVTAGLGTVALRVPNHPVALALLRLVGLPLAAPSANRSGEVSPTTAEHVLQSLGDRVAMVLDGGPTSVGIESTVVDLSGPVPVLLRPGMLSRQEIESEIGPILVADRVTDRDAARPSPGMLDRHYAPRARLVLYDPARPMEAERALIECRATGRRSAALLHGGARPAVDLPVMMPGDPADYARELYAALHRLDEAGVTLILAELPPPGVVWDGIRDRLTRASRGTD